jgi:hypothetical protein
VQSSACNVIGTNLLGYYNMSELTAVGTDIKQVGGMIWEQYGVAYFAAGKSLAPTRHPIDLRS